MNTLVVGIKHLYHLLTPRYMPMVSYIGEILPPPCTKIMPPFEGEPGSL